MGVLQEFYRNLVCYLQMYTQIWTCASRIFFHVMVIEVIAASCILLNATVSLIVAIAKVLLFKVAISGVWCIWVEADFGRIFAETNKIKPRLLIHKSHKGRIKKLHTNWHSFCAHNTIAIDMRQDTTI